MRTDVGSSLGEECNPAGSQQVVLEEALSTLTSLRRGMVSVTCCSYNVHLDLGSVCISVVVFHSELLIWHNCRSSLECYLGEQQ